MSVTLGPKGSPKVYEDWSDDGTFVGTYDDVTGYLKPGTAKLERGRDQGRVIGGPKSAFAEWTLTNESLLFSKVYTGSPLYGLVAPGHLVKLGKVAGDATIIGDDPVALGDDPQVLGDGLVEFPLMLGRAEEPKERYGIGRKQVRFSAYGILRDLVDKKISIPYQANITTGALAVLALQTAGLSASQYVVDPDAIANGRELLHYYADDIPAMTVLRTAWATEGPPASLTEDTLGRVVFWGRNVQSFNTRAAAVQRIVVDLPADDDDLYFADIDYETVRSSVINTMALDVAIKTTTATAQVWQYTGVLNLTGSQTLEIFAKNTSADPWINVITPVSPTDFTVTSGTLTSITATVLSPFTVKFTFVAGVGGAQISPVGANVGFSLRAQTVTNLTTVTAKGTVNTATSRALYGDHKPDSSILSDIWDSLTPTEADGLIDAYHIGYADPRELATITMESATGLNLQAMLTAEVLDRWHIFDQQNGFDHDVLIGQLTHELIDGGRHKLTIVCERLVELDWARWDVGRFDIGKFGN